MKILLVLTLIAVSAFVGCSNSNDENNNPTTPNAQITITGITVGEASIGQKNLRASIMGSNFNGVTSVNMGDGVNVQSFAASSSSAIDVQFSVSQNAAAGSRTITVNSSTSTASSSSIFQVINNRVPIAKFTVDPSAGSTSTVFTFDASASTDADNNIASYQWDFGNAGTDRGKKVTKKFNSVGEYTVALTVTDQKGATDSHQRNLEVSKNTPPIAAFSVSPSGGTHETEFHFDASRSFDPDGRIIDFLWNFGDHKTGNGQRIDHQYGKEGNFDVTLTVKDNHGSEAVESRRVEVEKSKEVHCGGGAKGPDVYVTIVDWNPPYVTVRPNGGGASCRLFYRCGDIRQGGDRPGRPEFWYGTICEMFDLGNGTLKVRLVRGNSAPKVGARDAYFHWQDCSGGYCR
jgi:PKD repeat protein